MWEGRPAWAEVDLGAIAANAAQLRGLLADRTELMAVVKANGYGHGAPMVARAALEGGASRLAVACADEGVQLRRGGIEAPILVMGYTPPWEAEKIVAHGLTPTVSTPEQALALASAAAAHDLRVPVHLKVDTGMGRFGFLPSEAPAFARFLVTLPRLTLEGFYTHFATADEADKTFTHQQFATYRQLLAQLEREGIAVPLRHAANSAATLDLPETHLDLVRCGITLYGLYPSGAVRRRLALRPALTLKSRVARLRVLPPGSSVGYGRTYIASAPTTVALVPLGYADGLRRRLSNRGAVLIRGRRAPIIGTISMDQFTADVSAIPGVQEADEVVIIGHQGEEEISADEVASLLDTINYEVLCDLSPRVPRVYLRQGQVVGHESLVDASALDNAPAGG